MVKLLAALDKGVSAAPLQVKTAVASSSPKGPMIVLPGGSSSTPLQTPATMGGAAVAVAGQIAPAVQATVQQQAAPKTRKLVTGMPAPYPLPTPPVIPGSAPESTPQPEGQKTTRTLLTAVPAPTTKVVANRLFSCSRTGDDHESGNWALPARDIGQA
ncbi:MAG: hypothetical protein ACON38_16660 [Akkermansiaceae bacterium]